MNELPIVYLGPSLPRTDAEQLLFAEYRPPVRRGDLATCSGNTVVIIDGEFGQQLSVSPKEILRLLDQGVQVFGAASMGALRAAELHLYGMHGYGWIFNAYQRGTILGDDEVALLYSPLDYQPLTVPLVNVRYWLGSLVRAGVLAAPAARQLFRSARRIFYADRTSERLWQAWQRSSEPAVLARLRDRKTGVTDIKAIDARLVLACLAAHQRNTITYKEGNNGGRT